MRELAFARVIAVNKVPLLYNDNVMPIARYVFRYIGGDSRIVALPINIASYIVRQILIAVITRACFHDRYWKP